MTYQTRHPLRDTLTKKDLKRIQGVIDRKHDNATLEELDAANDMFYDAIAAEMQTHYGVTTLQ